MLANYCYSTESGEYLATIAALSDGYLLVFALAGLPCPGLPPRPSLWESCMKFGRRANLGPRLAVYRARCSVPIGRIDCAASPLALRFAPGCFASSSLRSVRTSCLLTRLGGQVQIRLVSAKAGESRYLGSNPHPPLRQIRKNPHKAGFSYLAERGGFEPPKGRKPLNGFRDRRIRPLCHLSGTVKLLNWSIGNSESTESKPHSLTEMAISVNARALGRLILACQLDNPDT